jgi:hypothetical protein
MSRSSVVMTIEHRCSRVRTGAVANVVECPHRALLRVGTNCEAHAHVGAHMHRAGFG